MNYDLHKRDEIIKILEKDVTKYLCSWGKQDYFNRHSKHET